MNILGILKRIKKVFDKAESLAQGQTFLILGNYS